MASTRNIRGISIEIGGDTTKLENSLKTVYQKSTDLTRELRSVDRALKFNPKNVELTSQKQKILTEQVDNTRKRLNELKSAQAEVTRQYEAGEIDAGQYRAFQRELVETESILKTYERQLSEVSDKHKIFGKAMEEVGGKVQDAGNKIKDAGEKMRRRSVVREWWSHGWPRPNTPVLQRSITPFCHRNAMIRIAITASVTPT